MTKDYDFVFDFGKLSDEMIRSGMGHEDIRKVCAAEGARPPPRLPPLFDQMVSQKSFTNGKDDMPIVKKVQVTGLPPPPPLHGHCLLHHCHPLHLHHLTSSTSPPAALGVHPRVREGRAQLLPPRLGRRRGHRDRLTS